MSAKLAFLAAGMAFLIAFAAAEVNRGSCGGGHGPDTKGCCPEVIKNRPYYPDANYCYPKDIGVGIYYADGSGCYPDESGKYNEPKSSCPKERICESRCIRPDYSDKDAQEVKKPEENDQNNGEDGQKDGLGDHTTDHAGDNKNKRPGDSDTPHDNIKDLKKGDDMKPHHKANHIKCRSGQEPDDKGCCPREISGKWYYRDRRGCYPIQSREHGGLYADTSGCYPDHETAQYLKAGESCPHHRRCHPVCDARWFH